MTRYFVHRESDCVWSQADDEIVFDDPLVEEIDAEGYIRFIEQGYTPGMVRREDTRRPITTINREILAETIIYHRSRLRRYKSIDANCTDCIHFKQREQQCGKFDNADVPEEIVGKGCDDWVYDDIPF